MTDKKNELKQEDMEKVNGGSILDIFKPKKPIFDPNNPFNKPGGVPRDRFPDIK